MKAKDLLQSKIADMQVEAEELLNSMDSYGVSPIDFSNDQLKLDRIRKELQELEEQLELL